MENTPTNETPKNKTALTWWGILFAVLMPLIGVIIGITAIGQKKEGGGALIGIAIAAWFIWTMIFSGM